MLLDDRSELTIWRKEGGNSMAELRHRYRRFVLPSHRRPPDLWLAVLPRRVQQAHSRGPLLSSRIPHGGLVWCFWSSVYLVTDANHEDVASNSFVSFNLVDLLRYSSDTVYVVVNPLL
jgi:hypothetical protein